MSRIAGLMVLAGMLGLVQSPVAGSNNHENYALQASIEGNFAAEADLARRGDLEAEYYLSSMYREGRGTSKDPVLALVWLRKSAEGGLAKAQFSLAFRYRNGEGVRQSKQVAARWFERAALQKDILASDELAGMYRDGDGVTRDIHRALFWYANVADEDGAVLARTSFAKTCVDDLCTGTDMVSAYKYITVDLRLNPSKSDQAHSADLLRKLASRMTPEQVETSQRFAETWEAEHPLPPPVQ